MTTASALDIVQSIYDGFARDDLDVVVGFCAEGVVIVQDPRLPWGGRFVGRVGVIQFIMKMAEAIDSALAAEQLFRSGDQIVQYGRTQGTVRRTGSPFDVPECHVWTIRDGLVERADFYIDTTAMLAALAL
jgi:ketosteroid isomerase-like protein